MSCARFSVSIKRVPSIAVPIRRLSTTTIKNSRSTFHVNTKTFNYQPRTQLYNPLSTTLLKPIIFSRKFASTAKEFEDEITQHIQTKNLDAAESTFKNMREQKVNPSQALLSTMIMEFSAAGRADKSLELYDVLRKLGFSPDEKILNVVVSSLSQKFKTSAKPKEAPAQQQATQQVAAQQAAAQQPKGDTVSQELLDLQQESAEEDYEDDDYDLEEANLQERENVTSEQLTDHPIIIVHETGNNVFATATHQGKTLTSLSAGALGFKGSKRSTSVAAEALGRGVSQRLLERGFKTANIVLRTTPSSNSEGALKGLFASVQLPQSQRHGQLEIKNVAYHLCLAHNGCRPKKARRV